MIKNWKVLLALVAALSLVIPALVGCGTPAGDPKAGVGAGDIVVNAKRNGGGGGGGARKGAAKGDGDQGQ